MQDIFEYYRVYAEEERLFDGKQHYCEYLLSMHLLEKYMPVNGAHILDCCSGTGVYSFELARRGALVTAGDLVPENVEKMRIHPCAGMLEQIYAGNASDLSLFESESFDAVLCMGALYHLPGQEDRDAVLTECLRVLRPGGRLALAWHSVQALYMGSLLSAVRQMDVQSRRRAYEELDRTARTHCRGIFYGMTFEEIEAIEADYPVARIANGVTYPALYPFFSEAEAFSPEEYDRYIRCLIDTCEDVCAVRHAMHGLYIGEKRVAAEAV